MNENLHQQFVQLGRERNKLTYKLLQLLPEIFKSGIYKKYAATIEEYAGRFGGLSQSVVKKRLNLEKHLENKPKLKEAIASQGLYKVALVARVATPENEADLADKVENMSKSALEVLSKELRQKEIVCQQIELESIRTPDPAEEKVKLEFEGDLVFKFLRIKNKLGKNLSNKEILKKIIEDAYEQEFAKEDEKVEHAPTDVTEKFSREKIAHGFSCGKSAGKKIHEPLIQSRHIPVEQKRTALKTTNNRCGYPNCHKPYELFHHPERYSLTKNHNIILPLCKEHHEFAHNGLMEVRGESMEFVDAQYQSMRQLAIT